MRESEKLEEWVRYLGICRLRLNGLSAIQKNDPRLLSEVLKKLEIKTPMDLLKWLWESDSK